MEPSTRSWRIVRATWLTKRPSARAWYIAAWSAISLLLGSVLYWQNALHAAAWMPASRETVFSQYEFWRLWTTLFAHADLGHLVSNSFLFFIFGYFLSGYFGFTVFPLSALIFGGFTNAIVLLSYEPTVRLIGVSGVVYWMGGVWLVLYLLLDQQRTYVQRILRSLGVALAVFMPSAAFDPQVSYRTHLVGFILGACFALMYYRAHRETLKAAVVEEIVTETESDPEESHG